MLDTSFLSASRHRLPFFHGEDFWRASIDQLHVPRYLGAVINLSNNLSSIA